MEYQQYFYFIIGFLACFVKLIQTVYKKTAEQLLLP